MDDKDKRSLLIIDDESSNLKVLTHIFSNDYTVLTALKGEIGIERAIEYSPDLILLDIIMPGIDGYHTLSEIKSNDKTKNIPVIFITGLDSNEYQNKGFQLGAADYITKPFVESVVKMKVRNILEMSARKAGKLELKSAEYNTSELINDVVIFNTIKYKHKPIEFFLKIDENIPSRLFGDEISIKQILNNLLSNAFTYTAAGEVELSVSADMPASASGDLITIVFHVRDTGQGMKEEQIARLYEKSGSGMNVLMELIKMMNGEIIAKSEPGCGTLFNVRLPQKKVDSSVIGKETIGKIMHNCYGEIK